MELPSLDAIDALIADGSPADRAALVVQLAARLAALGAKMGAPALETLLEVEEAANIARVRPRRIWEWSRAKDAQSWAVHLGPRTLRVREAAFRAWWEKRVLTWARSHGKRTKRRERARGGEVEAR